jgi:hypothetical protein
MKCAIVWINAKVDKVEAEMNNWLAMHPNIEIKCVSQQPNFCYTIFYEDK